jgi:protein-tyrosine phosphatase
MKILMVCLGNICRSPLAQGILEEKAKLKGLNWQIDSCGTGSWHIGHPPDQRSVNVAQQNGLDISNQRARQLSLEDFDRFDLILAMDSQNYQDILKKGGETSSEKIEIILNYLYPGENRSVPDPYFGGGFEEVYRLLDNVCDKIIETYK